MKYFRRLGIALLTFVANEVFDQRLSKVTKIVELGPKVNSDGVVIGRRGMALIYSPELSFLLHGNTLDRRTHPALHILNLYLAREGIRKVSALTQPPHL